MAAEFERLYTSRGGRPPCLPALPFRRSGRAGALPLYDPTLVAEAVTLFVGRVVSCSSSSNERGVQIENRGGDASHRAGGCSHFAIGRSAGSPVGVKRRSATLS